MKRFVLVILVALLFCFAAPVLLGQELSPFESQPQFLDEGISLSQTPTYFGWVGEVGGQMSTDTTAVFGCQSLTFIFPATGRVWPVPFFHRQIPVVKRPVVVQMYLGVEPREFETAVKVAAAHGDTIIFCEKPRYGGQWPHLSFVTFFLDNWQSFVRGVRSPPPVVIDRVFIAVVGVNLPATGAVIHVDYLKLGPDGRPSDFVDPMGEQLLERVTNIHVQVVDSNAVIRWEVSSSDSALTEKFVVGFDDYGYRYGRVVGETRDKQFVVPLNLRVNYFWVMRWGNNALSEKAYVSIPQTSAVGLKQGVGFPTSLKLGQNYPNPFNPETVIQFEIPRPTNVELTVYDVVGRKVRTIVSGIIGAGSHEVRWDGRDDREEVVPNGIYFYRLESGNFQVMKKMILMK